MRDLEKQFKKERILLNIFNVISVLISIVLIIGSVIVLNFVIRDVKEKGLKSLFDKIWHGENKKIEKVIK